MLESQLVMREEDFVKIQSVIEKLTRDANSKGVFVVDKAGQLIGEAGEQGMRFASQVVRHIVDLTELRGLFSRSDGAVPGGHVRTARHTCFAQ